MYEYIEGIRTKCYTTLSQLLHQSQSVVQMSALTPAGHQRRSKALGALHMLEGAHLERLHQRLPVPVSFPFVCLVL